MRGGRPRWVAATLTLVLISISAPQLHSALDPTVRAQTWIFAVGCRRSILGGGCRDRRPRRARRPSVHPRSDPAKERKLTPVPFAPSGTRAEAAVAGGREGESQGAIDTASFSLPPRAGVERRNPAVDFVASPARSIRDETRTTRSPPVPSPARIRSIAGHERPRLGPRNGQGALAESARQSVRGREGEFGVGRDARARSRRTGRRCGRRGS